MRLRLVLDSIAAAILWVLGMTFGLWLISLYTGVQLKPSMVVSLLFAIPGAPILFLALSFWKRSPRATR